MKMLLVSKDNFERRQRILAALQRSKMQKIAQAFVMLVGGPWNWFMLVAGWGITTASGMITGALMCVVACAPVRAFVCRVWCMQ